MLQKNIFLGEQFVPCWTEQMTKKSACNIFAAAVIFFAQSYKQRAMLTATSDDLLALRVKNRI